MFDQTDIVQLQASASVVRDSNLFRLPALDPRLFGVDPDHKSDSALVKGIGIKIDKPASRQRLIAEMSLNETTYDKNGNLDFLGGEGRASWLWRIGGHWDGEASYKKRRSLGGFADQSLKVQDLVDSEHYRATAGYQFHPRWRVAAQYNEEEQAHSALSRSALDFHGRTLGISLNYRTPSENSLGVQALRTRRSYPGRLSSGSTIFDNNHTENRINAIAAWRLTGKLNLNAQLGHVRVEHEQLTTRDFSGLTWRAALTWDEAAKLRLDLHSSRDVRLYEDVVTSYIVVDAVGFSPSYAPTPKILVQIDLSFERRDFRGDPGFVNGARQRQDRFRLARLAIAFAARRNVDLSLSYEYGERDSSFFLNAYDYRMWLGTIRLAF